MMLLLALAEITWQEGDCGVSGKKKKKKKNFLSPPSLWYPWVTGIHAGFASGHGGASCHDFSHKQSLSIPPLRLPDIDLFPMRDEEVITMSKEYLWRLDLWRLEILGY